MSIDTNDLTGNHLPTDVALMLKRLVSEYGYSTHDEALRSALTNLLEDLDCDEAEESAEAFEAGLMSAVADINRGERGRPAQEVFDELRREFNISTDA